MAGVLGFQSAADLGPSPSENEQLRELCSRQAEQLERLQDLATVPQQPTRPPQGAIIRPEEKQALVQLLSNFGEQGKAQAKQIKEMGREIEDLRNALKDAEQDISEIREHFPSLVSETKKRISVLEARVKPKDTANNATKINTLAAELLARAKAGQKGVTYAEAAKILHLNKARICQLRGLIASDSRFDISWHPKKKNTKVICLKNYK
jgi:hypothetical protein